MRNANWLINTYIIFIDTYKYIYILCLYYLIGNICSCSKKHCFDFIWFLVKQQNYQRSFMLHESVRMFHFIKVMIPVNVSCKWQIIHLQNTCTFQHSHPNICWVCVLICVDRVIYRISWWTINIDDWLNLNANSQKRISLSIAIFHRLNC